MYESPKEGQTRTPKAKFYVSNANGRVYPAQKGLPGFEDDNSADWRVATADEIERYQQGKPPAPKVPVTPVVLDTPPSVATPSTLTLAPEEPEAPATQTPDSPTNTAENTSPETTQPAGDQQDPPPLPPGLATTPPPAFNMG